MRFSILIPSMNHGRFVGAAMDSCLAQRFDSNEFEVIAVDDGSTDDSMLVLEQYRNRPGVQLLSQPNSGQAAAFATGLAAAKGEFICLLDADDVFAVDKLSSIADWLDARSALDDDLFLCHDLTILDQSRGHARPKTWFQFIGIADAIHAHTIQTLTSHRQPYPFAVPCGQVYRRQTLGNILGCLHHHDWRRGADVPLAWGAVLAAGSVNYLHRDLGAYRVHDANGFIALQAGGFTCKIDPHARRLRLINFLERFITTLALDKPQLEERQALLEVMRRHLQGSKNVGLKRFVPVPAAISAAPLQVNPLKSRKDVAKLFSGLMLPLDKHRSPGCARLALGETGAVYPPVVAEMEGFCRPLWGLAAFAAGGEHYENWAVIREGLANGITPTHPEYWGGLTGTDQRVAELCAIAFALCMVPEQIWEPLSPSVKAQAIHYFEQVNWCQLHDNNWLFFRVLMNLALARIGGNADDAKITADLDRLESFHAGEGWYRDGPAGQCDYYTPFAMHYYGLLYCMLAKIPDEERCLGIRKRAADFTSQFIHWFAADGSALPYGRSLTYRFAQAAFWGALAFANLEALPWGIIKGLYLRNLRWWLSRRMTSESGLLTLGYAYPNLNLVEGYSSPGSPYWAFKAFLPLALPESHPFWAATEEALPDMAPVMAQKQPGMLFTHDSETDHVVAFVCAAAQASKLRHSAEKYAKFCYSNHFGFSVPSAQVGLGEGAHDNMLALSEDGDYFRVRRSSIRSELLDNAVFSEWRPWGNVTVRTWLIPAGKWHVRVHLLQTRRALMGAEGGFALPHSGAIRSLHPAGLGHAGMLLHSDSGSCTLLDLSGGRDAKAVEAAPNTNILYPNTIIPTLIGQYAPGHHWLACAIAGCPPGHAPDIGKSPAFTITNHGFTVTDSEGLVLYRWVRPMSAQPA